MIAEMNPPSTPHVLVGRPVLSLLAIAALLLGTGCNQGGPEAGPTQAPAAGTPVETTSPASAIAPLSLIYYDGHMHTTRSDGSGSVQDIKATALARGLSVVIITDHCASLTRAEWESLVAETAAASEPGVFLALPGFEITGSEGLFNRDHMLAYNVPDPFVGDNADELCPEEVWPDPPNPAGTGPTYPENLARWTDYVRSQGGFAVHNHTSGSTQLGYGVTSIEVYNQGHIDDIFGYTKLLGYSDEEALRVARTLNGLALHGERDLGTPIPFGELGLVSLRTAVHTATGQWLGSPEAPLHSWDELLLAYVHGAVDAPIFAVADSDAHNTGDPDSRVGVAKNGLYVTGLTADAVYDAIKAGRSFATTGPSLAMEVNDRTMGETAAASGGEARITLSVDAESEESVLVKVDVVKNGDVWQTVEPMTPTYENTFVDGGVNEDGYYRVEVTSQDADGNLSFAWSNPVFVEVP
jgi:hypothetical protein